MLVNSHDGVDALRSWLSTGPLYMWHVQLPCRVIIFLAQTRPANWVVHTEQRCSTDRASSSRPVMRATCQQIYNWRQACIAAHSCINHRVLQYFGHYATNTLLCVRCTQTVQPEAVSIVSTNHSLDGFSSAAALERSSAAGDGCC